MTDFLSNKVTRRGFLKLLGSGAFMLGVGAAISRFPPLNASATPTSNLSQSITSASYTGSWKVDVKALSSPIHAALLPNGQIMYITGSGDVSTHANGPFLAGVLDPVAGTQTQLTTPEDIFCGGNCLLPNGNVLVAGGTIKYPMFSPNAKFWGLNSAYEFDFTTNSFVKLQSMAHGRWYPTQIVLPNSTVLTVSGLDEFGCTNRLVEIFDPNTQSFSMNYDPLSNRAWCVGSCTPSGPHSPCYGSFKMGVAPGLSLYPRMHVMPNGLVASVGYDATLNTWNPSTGHWVQAGNNALGKDRISGSSVLLPLQNSTTETGRILLIAGAELIGLPATNTCEIVTPNGSSLQTRFTAPLQFPRIYLNATILPTGAVFVNGGTSLGDLPQNSVYAAEMFDPTSETWVTMPSATVSRRYHQVALLLPDGRVWTAGTTNGHIPPGELRTEIFSPAYVFGTRPTISGNPTISGGYGGSITIPTPNAENIESVSLIRVSSATHHFSPDQRLIWLQIQQSTSNSLTVAAPLNSSLAPPGYYMIFVLDSNSIPSVGQFIQIPSTSPPESITQLQSANSGTASSPEKDSTTLD